MQTQEENPINSDRPYPEYKVNRRGRIMGGLIVVAAGTLFLMRESGVIFPDWFFSIGSFLIVLGLFILVRHSFKRPGGIVLILVGAAFLVNDIIPTLYIGQFIWPAVLILIGLRIMFSSGRGHHRWRKHKFQNYRRKQAFHQTIISSGIPFTEAANDTDSFLDSTVFFGSVKKNIFAKRFKGGEAVTFFGGTEINLSQADIEGKVELELTQVFGGTKLIVPPHWQIKSELVAVMGGIEDKRTVHPAQENDQKVLFIKGTSVFGGIEINSY